MEEARFRALLLIADASKLDYSSIYVRVQGLGLRDMSACLGASPDP